MQTSMVTSQKDDNDFVLFTWGVRCTKHVRVYVSAQKGYKFEHCRITYTYNKHI